MIIRTRAGMEWMASITETKSPSGISDLHRPKLSTLAEILAPLDEVEFLQRYWNRQWTHIQGTRGRFENLLPWVVLNQLLVRHRLDEPRLMLFQDGCAIPTSSFISYGQARKSQTARVPQLHPEELTARLQDGATLVLDNVDEMYQPISELAESLERTLHLRANANAYAGWHSSQGFNLHWDDHDVFVLQVFGRKRWQIHGVTREYPLGQDVAPNSERPKRLAWEGIIESGDVLYIPRGVWHVAFPLEEPTLHLTVGFTASTGMDLLEWVAGKLCENAAFRHDLPRLSTADEKSEYLSALRSAVNDAWTPSTLDEYLEYCDYMSKPRPRLSLPYTPLKNPLGDTENLDVKWNVTRDVAIPIPRGTTFYFRANGKEWEIAPEAVDIVNMLRDRRDHSVSDICARFGERQPTARVIEFLNGLIKHGLLVVQSR
jgi:ribosomal protein L16 Arg81 hydroxylase